MAYIATTSDRETHALLEEQVLPYFYKSPDYALANVKGYDTIWSKPLMLLDSHNNVLARVNRFFKEKMYIINCDNFDKLSTAAILIGFILSIVILYHSHGIDVIQEYKFSAQKQNEYDIDNERLTSLTNESIAAKKCTDSNKLDIIKQIYNTINYISPNAYNLDLNQPNVMQIADLLQSRDQIITLNESDMLIKLLTIQSKIDKLTDVIILDKNKSEAKILSTLFGQLKAYINVTDANKNDYLAKLNTQIDSAQTKVINNQKDLNQLNNLNDQWTGRTYVISRQVLAGIAGAITFWAIFKRTTVHRAGFGKKRDGWKAVRNMAHHMDSVKNIINNPSQVPSQVLSSAKSIGKDIALTTKKLFTPQSIPTGYRVGVTNE